MSDKPFIGAKTYASKYDNFRHMHYEIVFPSGSEEGVGVGVGQDAERALRIFARRMVLLEFGADFRQKTTYDLPEYIKNIEHPSDVTSDYEIAYRPLDPHERAILEQEVKDALNNGN